MGLNFTDAVLKSIVQSCKAQHSRHFMLCGTAKHVSTLSHFRIFFLYLISLIVEPTCKEFTYHRSSAILPPQFSHLAGKSSFIQPFLDRRCSHC